MLPAEYPMTDMLVATLFFVNPAVFEAMIESAIDTVQG